MNSRVINAYNFKDVDISDYKIEFKYDEAKIERELARLANHNAIWTTGKPVAKGDVVVCSMSSEIPKFERDKISFTVGTKLFDKDVENAIINKNIGDIFSVDKNGQEIKVELLEVRNKEIKLVNDEMVCSLGIENVKSVEEYKVYLKEQQFNEFFKDKIYEPLNYIVETVLKNSDILLKQEDWQKYVDYRLAHLNGLAGFEGLELKTMTEQDFQGRIPVKSYDGFLAMLQKDAWKTCYVSLLGRALAEENGYVITDNQYNNFLEEVSSDWKRDVEEYKSFYSFEYYQVNSYGRYYWQQVEKWLRENLISCK